MDMKPRLPRFFVIILVLTIAAIPQMSQAQKAKLFPDAIPNGIASGSGEQYRQRFDITFTGAEIPLSRMFTITVPPDGLPDLVDNELSVLYL
jgi:hypothetical protein